MSHVINPCRPEVPHQPAQGEVVSATLAAGPSHGGTKTKRGHRHEEAPCVILSRASPLRLTALRMDAAEFIAEQHAIPWLTVVYCCAANVADHAR